MSAHAATFIDSGRSSARRIGERNERLFAEQQRLRRGPTLEVFFPKRIDNSRRESARCAFLPQPSPCSFR